jgi:hypothetical protein
VTSAQDSHDAAARPPAAPRKRRRFPVFRIALALFVILVLLVAFAPTLLSGRVRQGVVDAARDVLQVPVELETMSLGWTSGVSGKGLRIANPEGFGDRPFLELDSFEGDVAKLSLLGGRIDGRANARGLRVTIVQLPDGTTNLDEFQKRAGGAVQIETTGGEGPRPEPAPREPGEDPGASKREFEELLANLRFDLSLEDSVVEVLRFEDGELTPVERMEGMRVRLAKGFGQNSATIDFNTSLASLPGREEPGHIDLDADIDLTFDHPARLTLDCAGVELSRYQPIAAGFFEPGDIEHMAGEVRSNLRAEVALKERWSAVLDGETTIEKPRFAGAAFGGLDLQAPRWVLQPGLTVTAAETADGIPSVANDSIHIDLGFVRVDSAAKDKGKALLDASTLALDFTLDLDRLRDTGLPLPEGLDLGGGAYSGLLAIQLPNRLPDDPMQWLQLMALDSSLALPKLAYSGYEISDLAADIDLASGGAFSLSTKPGAKLLDGALSLGLRTDLANAKLPVSLSADLSGAQAGNNVARILQYAVPLLAGASAGNDGAVQLQAPLSLGLSLNGPALQGEGQSLLDWLSGWSGDGTFELAEGSLRPAGALGQIAQLAEGVDPKALLGGGEGGGLGGLIPGLTGGAKPAEGSAEAGGNEPRALSFDRLGGSFKLDAGALISKAMSLKAGEREYAIDGKTTLGGDLDWTVDLRDLFRGHKDGEKVLAVLGDTKLAAGIGGSLDSPKLAWPDLAEIARGALQNALQGELKDKVEGGLRDALRKGLGLPKKDKDG